MQATEEVIVVILKMARHVGLGTMHKQESTFMLA
jgi:hypothetical protein